MKMLSSRFHRYLLSMVTFMTQFYHAFGRTGSAKDYFTDTSLTVELTSNTLELASIMIQSFILVGLVLLFVRHGRLRAGSMTVILLINTGLMVYMKSNRLATGALPLVGVALLAGMCADFVLGATRQRAPSNSGFLSRLRLRVSLWVHFRHSLVGGGLGTRSTWTGRSWSPARGAHQLFLADTVAPHYDRAPLTP